MVKMLVQDERFKKVLAEIEIPEVEQMKSQSGSPAEGGGLHELPVPPEQIPQPSSDTISTEQPIDATDTETETYIISRPQTGDYLNKLFSVGGDNESETENETPGDIES